MITIRGAVAAFAAVVLLASASHAGAAPRAAVAQQAEKLAVTVQTRTGPHRFKVEVARTALEQERGLMFRTNIAPDGGMLFAPYPAEGGGPREASFWMKNTPSALDILFIRPDGTIAKIAANMAPYSEESMKSGEPVGAVLEIPGGRAAELGIVPGDKVSWPEQRG